MLLPMLLALGAVARLSYLIRKDLITAPLRAAVIRKYGPDSMRAYFITCAWCMSMWIALILVAPAAYFLGESPFFIIPALGLSLSYVSALLAENLE